MLIYPLPIINDYVDALSDSLKSIKPSAQLTRAQKAKLAFIIIAIIVTETFNWAAFERRSLGKVKPSSLHWFLYSAKVYWHRLLEASTRHILIQYGVRRGTLAIDDSEKKRSKRTTQIDGVHKMKDKGTSGFCMGQGLVFMVLVTDIATFPVDFRFFTPDPALTQWRKQDKRLREKGVAKKDRPESPEPDHCRYPTKQALAIDMVRDFIKNFPEITIKGVLADALYGTGDFMDQVKQITGGAQVISQLRSNQTVSSRNSQARVDVMFARQRGVERTLTVRGSKEQRVTMLSARLFVKAHNKRRFVIALKYENEDEYRYLVASDLSWRHTDIARLYTLRWLVEVVIQDWKAHGGWNRLSKHQGKEGSERGVILSLLCDHLLLLHPEQFVRLSNKKPGLPAGCLVERLKMEALVETIRVVIESPDPEESLEEMIKAIQKTLPTRDSSKHMAGLDLGRQEPTESLVYHAKLVA